MKLNSGITKKQLSMSNSWQEDGKPAKIVKAIRGTRRRKNDIKRVKAEKPRTSWVFLLSAVLPSITDIVLLMVF